MSLAILDLSFTKTLDAICESATSGNNLYISGSDDSLVCRSWFCHFFERQLRVADLADIIRRVDDALASTERTIELHTDPVYAPSVCKMASAALRVQQVFEAAKRKPTQNALINEVAQQHQVQFHLPVGMKGCVIGLATAQAPHSIAQARGPNILNGKYFYDKEFSYLQGLFQMAYMGLLTQLERLASVAVHIIQAVTRIFGFSLPQLNSVHYFRNNETDADIYDPVRMPLSLALADAHRFSSFWLGHGTCLFGVPVQDDAGNGSRVMVMTDPKEGALDKLLYPRMTEVGKPIEQCPPPSVCLVSHNHMDHFSRKEAEKLRPYDPLMVVPRGDGEYMRSLGLTRVVELNWFEETTIEIPDLDGKTYRFTVTGAPANHGSGNMDVPTRTSLFNGYVIRSSALDGDIYFAGDTARLDAEHTAVLRETFNIKYSFQPGGPDAVRSLNEDSHQASCEGLVMHMHLMVRKAYSRLQAQLQRNPTFAEVKAACDHFSTVYMHTKTYKLGNVHFDDTDRSVNNLLQWMNTHDSWDDLPAAENLAPHEIAALSEIAREEGAICVLEDGSQLQPRQVASLLEQRVRVPKIGELFAGEV